LPFLAASAITPLDRRPAEKGLPWRRDRSLSMLIRAHPADPAFGRGRSLFQESKMPKLKTKSGAKKRFKITGGGKVVSAMAGKRHGMIKRSKKQIRNHRGTRIMFKTDGDNIKKYFLPNG
jgi:large subunit ribosomal protein L35